MDQLLSGHLDDLLKVEVEMGAPKEAIATPDLGGILGHAGLVCAEGGPLHLLLLAGDAGERPASNATWDAPPPLRQQTTHSDS